MVVIEKADGRLTLRAPYHPMLAMHARELQGKWRGAEAGWAFGVETEKALRERCVALWGVDGTPEAAADTVTLRIEVLFSGNSNSIWLANNDNLWLCGREIISRVKGRAIARAGRGVRFVEGTPQIGTGPGTWWVWAPAGAVFLLRDVPKMAVPRFEAVLVDQGRIGLRH